MKKPDHIEITLYGNTYRIRVPKEVPAGKIDVFSELSRVKKKAEIEGSFRFTDKYGKNHTLPVSDRKMMMYLRGHSKEEKDAAERKNRAAYEIKSQIDLLKAQLDGSNRYNVAERRSQGLLEEYGSEVLEMLGKGYTGTEVHKALLDRGIDIAFKDIQLFHNNNKARVSELRTSFNEDMKDVSLYSKRCRLEKLSYLLNEVMDDFSNATNPSTRQKISAESRAIIEQARKEVEGEEVKLTVSGKIDVDATINAAAATMGIGEGLTIAQIVIARVAARLGLKSQYYIDHLATSYYARYSGFRRNNDLKTKPIYPTAVAYDIMDAGMEEKNREWQKNQKSYEEIDDQTDNNIEKQDAAAIAKKEMRERLMKLLARK